MTGPWSPDALSERARAYVLLEQLLPSSSRLFTEYRQRLWSITAAVDNGTMTPERAIDLYRAFINQLILSAALEFWSLSAWWFLSVVATLPESWRLCCLFVG
ncbi:hypothetical protein B7R23_16875 [Subtercola boreus]|nr:hypothetical protein B7R24_16700 [Subtercola boreus]RFA17686.1 hypothetical protein B7R23_16875 [Subtercola boreus]